MPPYEVIADEARGLVVVKISGRFDGKGLLDVIAQARKLSVERGWNLLYDIRQALPGEMGAGDLFWLPRTVPSLREPGAYKARVALIYPAPFGDFAQFWENTFRNAGLPARAFTDESPALIWLTEDRGQTT